MENHLASQNRSPDPQPSARDGHMRESRRLGYQLKYESTNVSHVDIHSKMVNDVNTFPSRSSKFLQKQQDNRKDRQREELVRYMSNLPSFLKKDVKFNEKAFSVGVLDFKLLEKWQHFHNIGNQHSPACSNISSFSSTEGSSSHSSSFHSLPPARQKLRYPTLQSHFHGSPSENCSHDTKSSEINKLKAQDRKPVPSGLSTVQQTTIRKHLPSDQKTEYRLKACKAKDTKVPKSSIARRSHSLEDVREKMKIQDSESLRRHHKMRNSFDTTAEVCAKNQETPRCELGNQGTPRCELGNKYPQIRRSLNLTDTKNQEIHRCELGNKYPQMRRSLNLTDTKNQETPRYELGNKYPQIRRSLNLTDTKTFGSKKASHLSSPTAANFEASSTELFCNKPPSCPPHESDVSHPHIEEPCSGASPDNKISSDLFRRFSDCGDASVETSGGKNLQEEKSIPAVEDEELINPSTASNTKTGSWGSSKVRNSSPTRRFSFSLSRVGKVSSSSATPTAPQSTLTNPMGTSGAVEAAISSSSLNNSKANGKGRSSPLRRLLEPLMRPARASLSDSKSNEPAGKSSEGNGDCTGHSVKVKLDLKTCKNVDAEVPHCSSKHVSSTVQALLQVAVRNGVPLFTFAVDNKNDILAATMRKSISGKEDFSCIYSFFIVQELKKKSGSWINHGRKDKGNSFVPNIVAQMNATDSFKQNPSDQSISKEYVLFSYDTKQAETSSHGVNDELAAVVVKKLKKSTRNLCQKWQGNENSDGFPTSKSNETHSLPRSGNNIADTQTEDKLSMTVLLPGGHHGQPIKGESSSLVKRWQSGGSCDCGGWDLGCRMRVLTDNSQSCQRYSSAEPQHTNKLVELFSQDGGQDQKPMFSLTPFNDGIHAVEFNSSIKILQAFSISLSILSCLKPVEFVETGNGLKEKSSGDITASETGGKKVYGKAQTEVPAFIANPPLSPVGRV